MADDLTFGELLSRLMEEADVGPARLVSLVNNRLGYKLLNRKSIWNWQRGHIKKPQTWQPLVGIAIGLKLKEKVANELLQVAGQPSLENLWLNVTDEGDRNLLEFWAKTKRKQIDPPRQLPPRIEHFVGRENYLVQLCKNLKPGRVEILSGPGGIGKTALASEALWRLADSNELFERFPDGVIFLDFYREPNTTIALEAIARIYGEEPHPTPAAAARRALDSQKALLVLDGTEKADDLQAVMAVTGYCGVLITSRKREDVDFKRQIITSPPLDESVTLLQTWGGERASDTTIAAQICKLVGKLPLAVRLAGSYIARAEQDAAEYLDWLENAGLEALDFGDRQEESIPVLLEKSLDQTGTVTETQQCLAVVGLLALAPFNRAVVATALDIPAAETDRRLGKLVIYSLLERSGHLYKVTHALVYTYARQYLNPSAEVVTKLATDYAALAEKQSRLGAKGYASLDVERPHIMAILAKCVDQKDWETVCSLAWAVEDYLGVRGHWTELMTVLEQGLSAAQTLSRRHDEGMFLSKIGVNHKNRGQFKQGLSYLRQALSIFQELNNLQEQARQLNNLGLTYRGLGKIGQATEFHQQALTISQETGDSYNECIASGSLGIIFKDQGLLKKAIKYEKRALAISQQIGDRRNEGVWYGNLGSTYLDLEDYEQAVENSQKALFIARELGLSRLESGALGNRGIAHAKLGKYEQAIDDLEQALSIQRETGDRRGEGLQLSYLGDVYFAMGQVEQAIEYYKQALVISREISHRRGEGEALLGLGQVYKNQNDEMQARKYLNLALPILEEVSPPHTKQAQKLLDELAE